MSSSGTLDISVVIPVHNEAGNLAPLHEELTRVLRSFGRAYEIVFVNDGSSDATGAELEAIRAQDPRVRVLELDGNFGEAAALSAGFHAARGEIIITLDGDGQNDPADIPRLLEPLSDPRILVVSGRRCQRQESYWQRVVPSRIANKLIARLTGVPVHDCGCGLKAYRRSVLLRVHLPRGMNRFLPAILGVPAQAVVEVPIRDRPRTHGATHYGLGRTFAILRDLLALRFLIRNPYRAQVMFSLATAGAAASGAFLLHVSPLATAICDVVAVMFATVWWNARRYNRAQEHGVYRLRKPAS